jgi:hypothetical protein
MQSGLPEPVWLRLAIEVLPCVSPSCRRTLWSRSLADGHRAATAWSPQSQASRRVLLVKGNAAQSSLCSLDADQCSCLSLQGIPKFKGLRSVRVLLCPRVYYEKGTDESVFRKILSHPECKANYAKGIACLLNDILSVRILKSEYEFLGN